MGQFNYTTDRLAANVTFPAHKFPYTTSVYYQCNVKLCALKDPECQMVMVFIFFNSTSGSGKLRFFYFFDSHRLLCVEANDPNDKPITITKTKRVLQLPLKSSRASMSTKMSMLQKVTMIRYRRKE